jgi:dihydropteroate synthase
MDGPQVRAAPRQDPAPSRPRLDPLPSRPRLDPLPSRVLFVTGRLAEPALRRTLADMAPPFACDVAVLKITVAALMTTEWISRFLAVPSGVDLVLIPGLCEGDPEMLARATGVAVRKGPKDLREIPRYFGRTPAQHAYGAYDIEILAEINNAPRMSRRDVRGAAESFLEAGADVIDIGCTPGVEYSELGDVVRELVGAGMRISIDSFDPTEIRTAVDAGAELVLSVNGSNLAVAADLKGSGARVVAVPELGGSLETLTPTLEALDRWGVPAIIDPILEPIGHGFMASLERYSETRRRYPDAELLMGVGNLTELTSADTTGVNAILIAVCQELGVRQVLTTEVIPWARGAVREIDIARRLMHFAVTGHTIPKGVDDRLVTVKDPEPLFYTEAELRALQAAITDPNFRIFADRDAITVFNHEVFVRGTDIQDIFAQLNVTEPTHAFYLGKELARASLAVTLGKTYRQEGALTWGYLTPPDEPHAEHVRLTQRARRAAPTKRT